MTTPAHDAELARHIAECRKAKAEKLADVATAMCQHAGLPATALAILPEQGKVSWAEVARTAGTRFPKEETRAMVIGMVSERLARPVSLGQPVSTWKFDTEMLVG